MCIPDIPLRPALIIDEFAANPRLAKLIPARMAFRYHTLPIAENDNCLTVVMADPEDQRAREQIRGFIGRPVHIVRGNQSTIDTLIAELWPESIHRRLHIAVLIHGASERPLLDYGLELGRWLKADEVHLETLSSQSKVTSYSSISSYDLVITGDLKAHQLRDQIRKSWGRQNLYRSKSSFLIARRVRLPIKKVLCVLRGQPSDLVSARWVTRLTHSTDCSVDVVVIVPQVPLMYAGMKKMQISLDEILREKSLPGRHLRRAVGYLSNWEIKTTMRLLPGYSPLNIEADFGKAPPDLIVISTHEPRFSLGVLLDDLVDTLVCRGETSTLIGRSQRRCSSEVHA